MKGLGWGSGGGNHTEGRKEGVDDTSRRCVIKSDLEREGEKERREEGRRQVTGYTGKVLTDHKS